MSKLKNIPDSSVPAVNVSAFLIKRLAVTAPPPIQYYHYHDCYELYILHSSERYYFINDKAYHISEGAAVLITPDTIHATANFKKRGYDRTVIYFKRDFIESIAAAVGATSRMDEFLSDCRVIMPSVLEYSHIYTTVEAIERGWELGDIPFVKTALAELIIFLAGISRSEQVPDVDYASPTHKLICEITGHINNSFSESITLDGVAKLFHISPCYLSRTFKTMTGQGFSEYLNRVRVKEAQKLLLTTDDTVLTVAGAVGFGSSTHFGRVFRAVTGMAPAEYRKQHKKDNLR